MAARTSNAATYSRDQIAYTQRVRKEQWHNEMADHFNKYIQRSPCTSIITAATNGTRAYPPRVHPSAESGSVRYRSTQASSIGTLDLDIPLNLSSREARQKSRNKRVNQGDKDHWVNKSRTPLSARQTLRDTTSKWASQPWSLIPSLPPSPLPSPTPATARSYREVKQGERDLAATPALAEWSLRRQRSPEYRELQRVSPGPQGTYWSGIESDEPRVSTHDGWRAASPQRLPIGQTDNSWSRDTHQAFEPISDNPMAIKYYPRKTTWLSKHLETLTFKQPHNLRS